jgi:pimeloyl-ACP methyl ester carboxylesterase
MTEAYMAAFTAGRAEAIATMVDFYGGAGTFASWPSRVRADAVATTAVNLIDWASAYGFPLSAELLSTVDVPTLVASGETSHPAMQRICALIGECMNGATLATVDGAAHFMIATHAGEVGRLLAQHAHGAKKVIAAARAKNTALPHENSNVLENAGATDRHPMRAPTWDTELLKSN